MSLDPHAVELTLLRAELARAQQRLGTALYEAGQAQELLGRYLGTLFPAPYAQAVAQGRSALAFAAEMYQALAQARVTLITAVDGAEPAPAVTPALAELTADHVELLRLAGGTLDRDLIWEPWERTIAKGERTFLRAVDELVQAGLLAVEETAAPRNLARYASTLLLVLTEAGRADYQARFGLAAVTRETFLERYGHSPEAWWLIRATRGALLAGGQLPAALFDVAVYDPAAEPLPADLAARYSNSEPDLLVILTPRKGGQPVTVAVECERARYSAPLLKGKVLKNLRAYTGGGLTGVYYVAPNREAGALIVQALKKIAADLAQRPALLERGFAAVFTLDALDGRWLPTPAMLNRWQGPPPENMPLAATMLHWLRHRAPGSGQPHEEE